MKNQIFLGFFIVGLNIFGMESTNNTNIKKIRIEEMENHAIQRIKDGDVAIKVLKEDKDFNFNSERLNDPTHLRDSQHPCLINTKFSNRKLNPEEFKKNDNFVWEDIPVKQKNSPPIDTKSTSTTLLAKTAYCPLFKPDQDHDYIVGLLFDATLCRWAKFAFYSEDAWTKWKPWLEREDGKTADKFGVFKDNLLKSYEDLKKHANSNHPECCHNELYTHVSKEALLGLAIRSEWSFEKDMEARILAICEKIKLEKKLKMNLPIIVINRMDQQHLPFIYGQKAQKSDWTAYWNKAIKDLSFHPLPSEFFGVTVKDIEQHFFGI